MQKNLYSYRLINIYTAIFIGVLLAFTTYVQFGMDIIPCTLCIMQRLIFMIVGLLFVVVSIHVAKTCTRKIYHGVIALFILIGIAIAMRHVYIQHLPPELAPSCGPGFNFIIENLPFSEAVKMLFIGSGECTQIDWHFLTLTMPEWSLICFVIIFFVNAFQFFRKI